MRKKDKTATEKDKIFCGVCGDDITREYQQNPEPIKDSAFNECRACRNKEEIVCGVCRDFGGAGKGCLNHQEGGKND